MDGTGTNDRAQDCKARLKTTITTWGALKKLYLKSEPPRARRYSFVASIELTDLHSETHFTEQTSNLKLVWLSRGFGEAPPDWDESPR